MIHRTTASSAPPIGQAAAGKAAPISHSYFVVMQSYGRRGLEAIVDPEITRREVISRIQSGEYRDISFIHHVDGASVEDVTDQLLSEARMLQAAE